jgi:4-hydroxybenzoate polyprenyltransferase
MIKHLIQLMRLDKPIGIYLLWFPTAWALTITQSSFKLWLLFTLGTIVMRAAGCVINDIADRQFDRHVNRTKMRPLTSGALTLPTAWALLIALLLIALLLLTQLPHDCFYAALPAAFLSIIYPYSKRFMPTPQMILSLAFASSIPMVYLATNTPFNSHFYILVLITIFWVLCYDTSYALVDLNDDLKIGVLSTARFFGKYVIAIIMALGLTQHALWLFILRSPYALLLWALAYGFWWTQFKKLEQKCFFEAFLSHRYYGLWMWLCLLIEHFH